MEYKDYKNRELNIRVSESQRILKKYPHMIPIILEKYNNQSPDLKYYKYLVNPDVSVGMFLYNIRQRCKLSETETLFLYSKDIVVNSSQMINVVYHQDKNEDNFLYFSYGIENTFG